jgi:8-oxo-dGTP pyrophosphatase MutT (NUDIX family)
VTRRQDALIVPARPAATVVIVRERGNAPYDVLLLRRNDKVAFMAGSFVFPGGRVDDADGAVQPGARFLAEPAGFADLSPAEEWRYRAAAVRELAEEANLVLRVDDLIPLAHWVTPEGEPRRYDTRFFLARMPVGQEARHDEGETTELAWLTPSEALERCRDGKVKLPPPTWTTLRQLESHETFDAIVAWARRSPIVRVMPVLVDDAPVPTLALPGDPALPAINGWTVPPETRFELTKDRGWQPTRP